MYEKRDCCVIASTGFGKSLIYQYPAVFMNKLTVVISPLIALMQDQVLSLKKKGIKACFYGSQQPDKTLRMLDHNIVYITPEFYFGHGKMKVSYARSKILMFAVDEAHIVDQWKDFRKDYGKLGDIRDSFPSIPIIALTATAPQYVEDIFTRTLKLTNFLYMKTALDRPNLEFLVQRKIESMVDIPRLLHSVTEGSTIIYCLTRDTAEKMSDKLNDLGFYSRPYHAGLNSMFRAQVVQDFRNDELKCVVCTIAFGMGIDKPDVRLVIHYGVSKSMEAYYQEAGRAGRDGKPSKCILFHTEDDFLTHQALIENTKNNTSVEERTQQLRLLGRMRDFLKSKQCRRIEMLNYLGTTDDELKKLSIRLNCCDNCKRVYEREIPPQLKYHGLDADGKLDFSTEARIFLTAVHKKLIRHQIVRFIMGEMPTERNYRWCKLQAFGMGRNKDIEWWDALASSLVQYQFVNTVGNTFRLSEKSKKFLRFKGTKLMLKPWLSILNTMEKKKNVEFYWQGEEILSRPVTRRNSIDIDDIFDDDLNDDEIIAACDEAERSLKAEMDEKNESESEDDETAGNSRKRKLDGCDESLKKISRKDFHKDGNFPEF